jgi:mannose-6-phosphate isomerase-like protein (cupin superfamily)
MSAPVADNNWFASADEIRARLREGALSFYPISAGTMRAGLYAPRGEDKQTPHKQDEIYVVNRGEAVFVRGEDRRECKAGDILFVPAGVSHRFEDFSGDFETWVIFYGPSGGEAEAGAGR